MEKNDDFNFLLKSAMPWFSYNEMLKDCFDKDILSSICFMDGNIFKSRYTNSMSEEKIDKLNEIIRNSKEYFYVNNENNELKILDENLSKNEMLYVISELLLTPDKLRDNSEIFEYLFSFKKDENGLSMPIKKLNIPEEQFVEILENIPGYVQFMLENKEDNIEVIDGLITDVENKKRLIFMKGNTKDLTDSKIVKKLIDGSYEINDEKFIIDFLCERCNIEEIFNNEEVSNILAPNIKEKLNEMLNVLKRNNTPQIVDIPENMRLGIEYEFFGNNLVYKLCEKYNFEEKGEQTIQDDYFCSHEAVSGILDKNTISDALNLADDLVETNHFVNETCGLHVHIDSKFLNVQDGENINVEATKYAWKNFLEMWMYNEDAMYGLVNKAGDIPRNDYYAKNMSEKIQNILKSDIMESETIEKFKASIVEKQMKNSTVDEERYYSVNFSNLYYGQKTNNVKDTIEFRLANGTLDSKEIKKTIMLYGKMLEKSKEYGVLDYKISQNIQLSQEEIEMFNSREKMKYESNEEKRTNEFIKIMFSDKELQNDYMDRYKSNCKDKKLDEYIEPEEMEYKLNEEKGINEYIEPTDLMDLTTDIVSKEKGVLVSKIKKFINKFTKWRNNEKNHDL